MCARFAELLAGSFNRFVLLIAHVYKLKSAVSWVAVAHRLVEGSGICIATSSSGVNSPVTVTPMPSRQRSLALEPNMAIAGRDYVPPITLRPLVHEWLRIAAREMSYQPSRTTPEISLCSKSSYLQMQTKSWLSHSPPGIIYGSLRSQC